MNYTKTWIKTIILPKVINKFIDVIITDYPKCI